MLDVIEILLIAGLYIYAIARELKDSVKHRSKCDNGTCTYYTHYLRHGPPTLNHAAFHQAERECGEWQQTAIRHQDAGEEVSAYVEHMCLKLEKEIRA